MTSSQRIIEIVRDRSLTDQIRAIRIDEVLEESYWNGHKQGVSDAVQSFGDTANRLIKLHLNEEDKL
jgi:hypothetical protein